MKYRIVRNRNIDYMNDEINRLYEEGYRVHTFTIEDTGIYTIYVVLMEKNV